jgi:curved DNA-binding protein CbpA
LWDSENRWEKIGMDKLVTGEQVRKQYLKAVLLVHPDKLTGDSHIDFATLIFEELKEAWQHFQKEGQKNLF